MRILPAPAYPSNIRNMSHIRLVRPNTGTLFVLTSGYLLTDLNQKIQDDPHYVSLRARANEEGGKMARSFKESKRAHAKAKTLSNEDQEHKTRMEQLDAEASAWVYAKNNEDSAPGEINLHDLSVEETVDYAGRAIEDAKCRGDTTVNLIVGKGLHSEDGVAELKSAVEALVQKRGLVVESDPDNVGVLIVRLGEGGSGSGVTGAYGVTPSPVVPHGQDGPETTGPPTLSSRARRGWSIIFGLLTLFSIIELVISAWLISMYNKHHTQLPRAVIRNLRYVIFNSLWGVLGFSTLAALYGLPGDVRPLASIGVFIYLSLTWILTIFCAGNISGASGDGFECSLDYTYCEQLTAIEAFAWIIFILTTVVVFAGYSPYRRGDARTTQLC